MISKNNVIKLKGVIRQLIEESSELGLDDFEHGRCELFALALHEELGYDIKFFVDEEAEIETEDGVIYDIALIHAYTEDENGVMFDATGKIKEDDLEDHADFITYPNTLDVEKSDYSEFVSDEWIATYSDDDIKKAKSYIRANLDKYKV
jgi:hypothetical protein